MIQRSQQSSNNSSQSWLRCCLLVALLGSSLVQGAPRPQLASSEDADGNTVVFSAGTDAAGLASTTILSTELAATTAAAAADPTTAVQDPATSSTSIVSQNLGQEGLGAPPSSASAGAATSTAPPTTYLVYYTVNGVQTSGFSTFSATFAPTPSPQAPMSGSVLAYTEYLPPRPTTTGADGKVSSGAEKSRKAGGAVAGVGLLLCVGLGAVMLL